MAGENANKHFLLPGALYAKSGEHIITTILGSCIAICLWDPSTKQGGMNHYKLPLWNGDGLPSPKFGNIAVTKLVENLVNMGCNPKRLQAKMFGGGAVIQNSGGMLNIGERNIEAGRDLLAEHRIPIVAENVGGEQSRKVIFRTWDGAVMMKKAAPK